MPVIKNLIWILAITVFVVSRGHILSFFKTKIVSQKIMTFKSFDDFKNKRFDKLISALDADKERLQEAVDEILQLNPKPGEALYDSRTNYIIPDLIA